MKDDSTNMTMLSRLLERERRAREILEQEVEEQTRRLYLSHEYLQKVIDTLGVLIVTLDKGGRCIRVNALATRVLGTAAENLCARGVTQVVAQETTGFTTESLSAYVGRDFELIVQVAPDSHIPFMAHLSEVDDDHGERHFILTLKDITERRRKEAEMRELQNQLIESAFRDGVAENAVSVLHNIGNILTMIMGKVSNERLASEGQTIASAWARLEQFFAGLQRFEEFEQLAEREPKLKVFDKFIHEAAILSKEAHTLLVSTLEDVTQGCAHISEVIAAQQNYANFRERTKSFFSARTILGDCLVIHRERFEKNQITVTVEDFPFSEIYMERIGFAQTINNAITNAVEAIADRYAKDGSYREKHIQLAAQERDGMLVISVSDNGAGIEKENLTKLFQFGFSTKGRRSGFGLHNCANFMKSNNGLIEILSEGKNLGATTRLHCPLKDKGGFHESAA